MRESIGKTRSICPECKKELEAEIFEESGSIFMEKRCDSHGFFKVLISKYSWYYKDLDNFYNLLFPNRNILNEQAIRIFQFYPTLRCNLNCNICFSCSGSEGLLDSDLSIEEIRKMATTIKGKKRIGILGGEPTFRNDLPEIIRTFSQAGHQVWLYTNGLRLKDPVYVQKLKKSGISYVWLWVDTLRDEGIYIKIRGIKLLSEKKKALDNLKSFNVKTGIINVVVRGVNECEIEDIISFSRNNRFITGLSIRGYSNIGRLGFSLADEFVMDELINIVKNQTKNFITLEEFLIFQKILYIIKAFFSKQLQCYVCQYLYIPRMNNLKKFRDIFPYQEFSRYLNDFQSLYMNSPLKAKIFFLEKIFKKIIKNPLFSSQVILQNFFPYLSFYGYLLLEVAMFYTPYNIDLVKTQTRCTDAWLPDYQKGELRDFCSLVCGSDVRQKLKK